jgi:quercetin dioxygenase-like cupin family protein
MTDTDPSTGPATTVRFERAHDIVIEAPALAVLDYVSNPRTWPEWMPATHEIVSDDRPLRAGESFDERWATRQGEVGLAWRVTARTDPSLWVAETETTFTGPIVARYEITELGDDRCRYVRRIVNPDRPKAPTDDMIARIDAEAEICLANIKANVEARHRGLWNPPELRSRYVDPDEMDWQPSDFPGIETKVLWSDPETGRSTILFKLAPGAIVPAHEHVDVEQTWVLSGSFEDHEGRALAGHYIWRPAGNRHEARSVDGAVILALFGAPNRFDAGSRFYTD